MKWPRIIILLFCLSVCTVFIANIFSYIPKASALTEQEIAQQKSQKQKQLESILKDINATASSKQSISAKLAALKQQKKKLQSLVDTMNGDLTVLQTLTKEQEAELVTLANAYSLQRALFYVDSQKDFVVTLFETPGVSQIIDRLLYYNVQTHLMAQQHDYIATKQQGVDEKKKSLLAQQVALQKSLSDVNSKIADLENQQQQLTVALSKNYSQRNSLVADISKLSKAAQAIINKKANSVKPPTGVGAGSGGGTSKPPASNPTTTGSISIIVGGVLVTKTDKVVKAVPSNNAITVKGSWTTEYAGNILFDKKSGVFAINELPLDQYLWGLAEMPSSWPAEALKAQAIAGRSYAVYKMKNGGYGKFDLYDYVQDQEYSGLSKIKGSYGSQWKAAVDSTSNMILKTGSTFVQAMYSAENGGYELSSQESPSFGGYRSYLTGRADRYQLNGKWVPYGNSSLSYWKKETHTNTMALMTDYLNGAIYYQSHNKTVKTTGEQSPSALAASLGSQSITNQVGTIQSVVQIYDQGDNTIVENTKYTKSIEVTGTKGKITLDGKAFKTSYNVRAPGNNSLWSTLFDIVKVSDNNWQMWSRGYGHRVGMSQYGAYGRAQIGQNYTEILTHYYKGVNVVQYDIGRNVRVALAKVGSRVMKLTSHGEIKVYDGSTLLKTVPPNTELRIEYN